ncbi:MAG TPA: M48 family metallopeptidase [Anaeromyxobacter sp.]|nr:M48 family metallopeptidase [Anaeromyxobacter sp.]
MTRSLAALLAAATLAACARNPVTGKRQLSLISKEQEIALGKEGAAQVEQSIGRYPDPKVQAYVEAIGKKMAAASERPDLPWSFTVLDDPSVNAFALPGGPVFVTRGILGYMTSEAELASVLGHEIGHITARHSAEQLSKAQLAQLGLGVGMIFSEDLRQYGQLAGVGLQLVFLKFGRDAERQADDLGFKYMVGQRYDPREMARVFRMLDRQTAQAGGGGRLPEWLSTHPNPGGRAEKAADRAAKVTDVQGRIVDRDEYLAHLGGMVFGENPRQGFFQGNAFLHPDLRFRIDFPEGWQKQNTAAAVVALSPQKDAAVQLSIAGKLSPEQARAKFFSQEGVKPLALGAAAGGAAAAAFEAQTEQGALRGIVSFVPHGGATYQLVGFTPAQKLDAYAAAFQRSFATFGPLTDPAALAVQPARIELVKVPRDMTAAEFQAQFPSSVPPEVVALANGLADGEKLEAGRTAKRIVGGELPKR